MLTIEKIKKELDAGREIKLECVDKNGLLGAVDSKYNYNKLILESSLQVSRYFIDGAGLLVLVIEPGLMMTEEELQYFRIKRPAPTFNDLIDVALQAWKDKAISSQLTIMSDSVHFFDSNRSAVSFTDKSIAKGVDYIKSLYTEIFVIENNTCVLKIRKGARMDFANSYSGYAVSDGIEDAPFNYIQANMDGTDKVWDIPHRLLKGATVTQKRGAA